MKRFILALILVVSFATPAFAQQAIAVDIAQAKLVWTWSQGTGGTPTEFRIKCGQTAGTYTKTTTLTNIALREVPISQVITGVGNWFCTGTVANEFGESAAAAEVSFRAGAVPAAMGSLVIQAQ